MQIEYNGTIIDIKKGTKVIEFTQNEVDKSNNEIIACRFNNEIKSLNYKIEKGGNISRARHRLWVRSRRDEGLGFPLAIS